MGAGSSSNAAARMQLLDLAGSHHVGSPGSLGSSVPADGSSESEFPCPVNSGTWKRVPKEAGNK